jgi:putative oxidoreductase
MYKINKISFFLLRFSLAGIFVYHGMGKLQHPEMASMMKLPTYIFIFVGIIEIAAGFGFVIGVFLNNKIAVIITKLSALAIMPIMVGAIAFYHWGRWRFLASETHPMGGMEFQVLILSVVVFIFFYNSNIKNKEELG